MQALMSSQVVMQNETATKVASKLAEQVSYDDRYQDLLDSEAVGQTVKHWQRHTGYFQQEMAQLALIREVESRTGRISILRLMSVAAYEPLSLCEAGVRNAVLDAVTLYARDAIADDSFVPGHGKLTHVLPARMVRAAVRMVVHDVKEDLARAKAQARVAALKSFIPSGHFIVKDNVRPKVR